jgi:cytochrome bd-type quinol oxidase subunit 2
VAIILIAVFGFALTTQLRVLDRWLDDPRFVVLQLLGMIAMVGLLTGVRFRRDGVPFAMAILLVVSRMVKKSNLPEIRGVARFPRLLAASRPPISEV